MAVPAGEAKENMLTAILKYNFWLSVSVLIYHPMRPERLLSG